MSAVSAITAWDVIFPFDDAVDPAKHKMWVCVEPGGMWFLRINSNDVSRLCVPLPLALHKAFLTRDSFLGCGGDLVDLTEAEVEQAMSLQTDPKRQGVIGRIDVAVRLQIRAAISQSRRLSPFQKGMIAKAL